MVVHPSRGRSRRLAAAFWALCLAWLVFIGLASCNDPGEPPPALDTRYRGVYDAASRTLSFPAADLDPSLGPLRLVATSTTFDGATGRVHARVALRNSGSTPIAGPDGIGVFALPSWVVAVNGICARHDTALPPSSAAQCFFDHRGTYGADGMLGPGETSRPVEWILTDANATSFTLRAEMANAGVVGPGEIAGVFFDDADHDGVRDSGEAGVFPASMTLAGPDSVTHAGADSSGHWSVVVASAGTYHLTGVALGCCSTASRPLDVEITRLPDGSLSGYGRADFGCRPGSPGLPAVAFVDVRGTQPFLVPCAAAAPCTIPFGVPFEVRFTGVASCDRIAGFQWQGTRPHDPNLEPFQPFGSDSLFLPAGHDTVVTIDPDSLIHPPYFALVRDTVTVRYEMSQLRSLDSDSGTFTFRARVRDALGLVSPLSQGTRRIVLNFDPDTRIEAREACNCSAPPPGCAARGARRLGWITDIADAHFPVQEWIPFCDGDTIPMASRVQFFAAGRDDPRDEPWRPGGPVREVGYAYRFTWRRLERVDSNMPFSPEYAAQTFTDPAGGAWRGGSIGWTPCPFDYTFFAAAVDEHGRTDGTPDSLRFYVSGSPAIDSVVAPHIVVLVPTCPSLSCPPPSPVGPDTMLVPGVWRPDPAEPPVTPLGLGYNEFTLPMVAVGHDSPLDRNTPEHHYYASDRQGRIHTWNQRFDCAANGCDDLVIPGEGVWRDDLEDGTEPPGRQVSDRLRITLPLDTLCTASPCSGTGLRIVLGRTTALGPYTWIVQGRDTRNRELCPDISDLGPNPAAIMRQIHDLGRTTPVVTRDVILLQVEDLHSAAKPSGPSLWRRAASRR